MTAAFTLIKSFTWWNRLFILIILMFIFFLIRSRSWNNESFYGINYLGISWFKHSCPQNVSLFRIWKTKHFNLSHAHFSQRRRFAMKNVHWLNCSCIALQFCPALLTGLCFSSKSKSWPTTPTLQLFGWLLKVSPHIFFGYMNKGKENDK